MPLICVCVPPWVWLMQRLHQLWHRSLLLIISQHALGRVPPSSARPAKDPPPPSEFCNHTPHSPAAPRHWMLETNTLAHVRQHKHTLGLWRVARLSESHNGTWTRIAGINDDGGMQQPAKPADGPGATGQPIKICTLRGEQTEEARVSVILLDFQLLNCYQQE